MTDTNPSGASFAPAADTSAPAASTETTAGNFGSTRGSGLARGKRQSSAAAPTANTAKSDYKPSALEVITPASEYKNPFASHEPATPPAEEPAKVDIPAAPVAARVEPEPQAAAPEVPMFAPEPEPVRREIQILPPAETARPAVSWESPSMSARSGGTDDLPRHDERPMFRPDRREDAAGAQPAVREPQGEAFNREPRQHRDPREQRQPRDPRELRQPRDPRDARQPRDPRDARQPRDPREARQPRDPRDEDPQFEQRPRHDAGAAAVKPAGGFFAWLKSLFGGPKPVAAPVARESGGDAFEGGQRHRRRHRGGRGHGGNSQGYRGDRSSFQGGPRQEGQPGGEGEHRGGDRQGGPRRRRQRGGPGRDRGGEPRSEGRQGGGAI